MKKLFLILFGTIIIVSLGIILVWNTLPTIISHNLSKYTGVSVTVGGIQLTPSKVSVHNTRVGNPPQYKKTPRALSVKNIDINTPISHFLDKNIIIETLTMDNMYVGIEFDSKGSKTGNWTTIINHLNAPSHNKNNNKNNNKSVTIKKIIITDINIEVAYKNSNQKNIHLKKIPRIELNNISSKNGLPTQQLMNIIMEETLRNLLTPERIQGMLKGLINPEDPEDRFMETLKGFFSNNTLTELDSDHKDIINETNAL